MKSHKIPTPEDIVIKAYTLVIKQILAEIERHCQSLSFEPVNVTTNRLPHTVNMCIVRSLERRGWRCRIQRSDRWRQRFVISPREADIYRTQM